MLSFFPRGVLDEILNLIESVSEDFPSCSFLLYTSPLPIFFLILQALRPDTYILTLCFIWSVYNIPTAFQEFAFIMTYYPFISSFGARAFLRYVVSSENIRWCSDHMSIRKDALKPNLIPETTLIKRQIKFWKDH